MNKIIILFAITLIIFYIIRKKVQKNGLSLLGSSRGETFLDMVKRSNVDHKYYLGANFVKLPDLLGSKLPKYLKYKEKYLTLSELGQGSCNACWSFTVTQMIADRISIMTGGKIFRPLSAQEMISCFRSGNSNKGCTVGGIPEYAYSYIAENGISTQDDYEYLQRKTTQIHGCQRNKLNGFRTFIDKNSIKNICMDPYIYKEGSSRYNKIIEDNVLNMKRELLYHGPFVGTIYVKQSMHDYDGLSVYRGGDNDNSKGYGHAVVIVGYSECGINTDEKNFNYPYWIVRNSWGSDWNKHNNGYFYIEMGNNICGIESRSSSAIPKLTEEIKMNRTDINESRYISYSDYINDPEKENYINTVGSK